MYVNHLKKSILILLLTSNLFSQETSKILHSKDISISIYNNNLAMINEHRSINLKKVGKQTLIYEGIPSSVIFESIIPTFSKETILYSQNYHYDILSLNKLLQKHINKEITYKVYSSAYTYKKEKAVLLSLNPILLQKNNEIISGIKNSDIIFDSLPKDLLTKPSLIWNTKSKKGLQNIELNYLTRNISWKSDYILKLDKTNSLSAWITINNNSGKSYENANIYVIAGEVQTNAPKINLQRRYKSMALMESSPVVSQKEFAGYHLYKIPFKESINNKEKKQINFINKQNLKIKTKAQSKNSIYFHAFNKIPSNKLSHIIELNNTKNDGLGIPLPKGTIRVYKKDETLSHFIGQSSIKHTSLDEKISINIGKFFDISQEIKQTAFKRTKRYIKSSYIRKIENKSNTKRLIEIREQYNSSNVKNIDIEHNCKNNCSFKKDALYSYIYTIELPKKSSFNLETQYELTYQSSFN